MLAVEFLESYQTQLRKEAAGLISQPIPELTESLFSLFEINGNRLAYESVYFARRKFLTILGLQAIVENEDHNAVSSPILLKLDTVIKEICSETCWALPAHVDRKQSGCWNIPIVITPGNRRRYMLCVGI